MSARNNNEKRFFTGHAFFTPDGGKTIELADAQEINYSPTVSRIPTKNPGKGVIYSDAQVAREIGQVFDFTANRLTGKSLQLLIGSGDSTDDVQASGSGLTASFSAVYKGQPLDVGKEKITLVSVTKGATTLVSGIDYIADVDTGIVRLLSTGTNYTDGDNILVTFNCLSVTRKVYSSQTVVNRYGNTKLILFDQGAGNGRIVISCYSQLTCDDQVSIQGASDIVQLKFKIFCFDVVPWRWLPD